MIKLERSELYGLMVRGTAAEVLDYFRARGCVITEIPSIVDNARQYVAERDGQRIAGIEVFADGRACARIFVE